MKLTRPEIGTLVAIAAIVANVLTWQISRARQQQDTEAQWRQAVEARLTRLETKMDRLLNTTDLALSLARTRLPKTR